MTQESLESSKIQQSDREIPHSSEESVVFKTVRLTINLVTNVLIVMTVFVCLLYAWTSPKLNIFQLHIVLCILGYQFFMTQGTLVLSRYNSWSMYLPKRARRHLHIFLQLIGIILVTVGSSVMIYEKHDNFNTAHGILGLIALVTSLLGLLNGALATYAYRLRSYISANYTKHFHYVTGVGTLIFSAICLCLGLNHIAFKSWSGNDDAIALMVFTCLFTLFVAIDYWISIGRRIGGT